MTRHKIGPWTVNDVRTVFDNPWISLEDHDITHPDGSPGEYGVVRFKNCAVGILPVDDEGFVWLVGQHRFTFDRYSWELPEGGGPIDQSPLESAQRELAEETGLVASQWEEFCRFDISNSVTDERAICFFAWDLTQGAPKPDPSEVFTLERVPFADLFEMVMRGDITDSLTIVMTLTAHAKALRGEAPGPISSLILDAPRGK